MTLIADKIAIGKTLTYTFRVTVEDGAQGQYIVNTAKVTSPDREDMQLPDTGVEISGGQTEPIMTKTASVKKAKPGDTFTYTVEVKNGAKATADWKNVALSDVLPVGVELVGGTVAIDDTTTQYTLAGQVLEVKLGNLKPNESIRVTFQVKVLERAAEDIIRNVATAQGDNGKKTASDNGVEIGLGKGELSGTKAVSQTTAKVGDVLTYTITAHNSDKVTSNLKDVIITDTLSEYLTLNPDSVQVDGLPARHFFDGTARQLRVELGDLAPGQTKTVTFTAAVNSHAYGKKFGNTAVITAKNGGPVTVTTPSDVTVADGKAEGSVNAKTVDKSKAKVGDTLTYSIAVRNASTASGPWKNVEVVDVIPEHLSFVSGSVEVNGRSTTDFSYNASSRTLKLLADSVEPGQTKTFSFRVTVGEGSQGLYITNTAVVKSPDREDIQLPDTGVAIDGGQTAPSLTKTASKTEVKPGDIFTYTIKVANLGKYAAGDLCSIALGFPAATEQVQAALKAIGVDGLRYEEILALEYTAKVDGLANVLSEYAGIDELNYLACRLQALGPDERIVFSAALKQRANIREDLPDLINLTYNLDCYEFYPGVNTYEEYGWYLVDNELGFSLPEQAKHYFDYEAYGESAAINEGGVLTAWGYISRNQQPFEIIYQNEVPPEYRVFRYPMQARIRPIQHRGKEGHPPQK